MYKNMVHAKNLADGKNMAHAKNHFLRVFLSAVYPAGVR
jgi:hypothetical protein